MSFVRSASRLAAVVLTCVIVVAAAPVGALEIGGGGSGQTDCLLTLQGAFNEPARRPQRYRCTDGDPCDGDGVVNGRCEVSIAACANSTFDPTRCTLRGVQSIQVEHAADNGDPRFDTEFQALQNRIDNELEPPIPTAQDLCTSPVVFHVQVLGPFAHDVCRRNRKELRINTYTPFVQGRQKRDTDRIRIECLPAANGCDPAAFFTGTFDRIQRQIFTPTCAVSACHDSQSQQNDLLLESGGSYSNLVSQPDPTIGVTPFNTTAAGLGWKRIVVTTPPAPDGTGGVGDSANSYLYHKVSGMLPAGTGSRMPFGAPALDPTLVEIVRLWIEAGAPQIGWVPGTM